MDKKERDGFHHICAICKSATSETLKEHIAALETLVADPTSPPTVKELAHSVINVLKTIRAHEEELEIARAKLKKDNLSLQNKVHALEINIDQLKKNTEVAQIAKSAFFKKIKQKADKRRKK